MAHYSLLNNDDRGDIETFLAASVQCDHCHGEAVVKLMDAIHAPKDSTQHALGCQDKSLVTIIKLDWYYAFGSEGFNWVDEPEGPFKTEAEAKIDAAEKVAGLPPIADDWIHQIASSLRPCCPRGEHRTSRPTPHARAEFAPAFDLPRGARRDRRPAAEDRPHDRSDRQARPLEPKRSLRAGVSRRFSPRRLGEIPRGR